MIHVIQCSLLLQGLLNLLHAVTLRSKVQVKFKLKTYAVEIRGVQPLQ